MKIELCDYDVYPKVVLSGRASKITVSPLGAHVAFAPGVSYTALIHKASESNPEQFPERSGRLELSAVPNEEGNLVFSVVLEGEGEHYLHLCLDAERRRRVTLCLYSLLPDMAGRVPLRGDLHMHSCRSDGREAPEIVTANYRGHGYDFFSLTDHHRYYPSLEVMEYYRDLTDFNLVPGEEVHLPLNPAHFVNFGGTFSVNALVTPSKNEEKAGVDFIGCTVWGNAAEYFAHYGARGALLSVEGSIRTGSYTNQSGQKVYTTEVSVEKLKLHEFKKANNPTGQASVNSGYIDPDDLPF